MLIKTGFKKKNVMVALNIFTVIFTVFGHFNVGMLHKSM